MKEREWILGDRTVDELYEYKNLGVLKNYIGSFSSNVEDNIDKTRKKAKLTLLYTSFIYIVAKLTLLYESSFGAKHVCPPYCMALSSLLFHHLYLQTLNDVNNGSSKIFSMYQISFP